MKNTPHRKNMDYRSNKKSAASILQTAFTNGKFIDGMTKDQIVDKCHTLFDAVGLDTPWTAKFFINLNEMRSANEAMIYVSNAMLRGSGLGMSIG